MARVRYIYEHSKNYIQCIVWHRPAYLQVRNGRLLAGKSATVEATLLACCRVLHITQTEFLPVLPLMAALIYIQH
jgi:hypothetical protein